MVVCAAAGNFDTKTFSTIQSGVQSAIVGPPIKVTLRQITDEYGANPVRADEKYGKRVVQFPARAYQFSKDEHGSTSLIVIETIFKQGVCFFDSSEREVLANLELGQDIWVAGSVKGAIPTGFPGQAVVQFEHCRILGPVTRR